MPTRARMGRAILPPSLSLNWTLCFERGEGVPLDGQLACLWAPALNDGKVFFAGFNKVNNWHWHCIWDTDHTTEKTFYSSLSRFQPSAEYHTWSHFVFCVVPLISDRLEKNWIDAPIPFSSLAQNNMKGHLLDSCPGII